MAEDATKGNMMENWTDFVGAPHSAQRTMAVGELLTWLRSLGWRLGTRTDLEEWPSGDLARAFALADGHISKPCGCHASGPDAR